jgi:hypothetical protein
MKSVKTQIASFFQSSPQSVQNLWAHYPSECKHSPRILSHKCVLVSVYRVMVDWIRSGCPRERGCKESLAAKVSKASGTESHDLIASQPCSPAKALGLCHSAGR